MTKRVKVGGRVKGTPNQKTYRTEKVWESLNDLLDATIDQEKAAQALQDAVYGVFMYYRTKTGKIRIYQKDPDMVAHKIYWEQRYGKAPQRVITLPPAADAEYLRFAQIAATSILPTPPPEESV